MVNWEEEIHEPPLTKGLSGVFPKTSTPDMAYSHSETSSVSLSQLKGLFCWRPKHFGKVVRTGKRVDLGTK